MHSSYIRRQVRKSADVVPYTMDMTGTRNGALERAQMYFDTGGFLADLQRRVAIPTTSQEKDSIPALHQYVAGEMTKSLKKLGYECEVVLNPRPEFGPFLIARRFENPARPTVLTYGHGDVVRGQQGRWRSGLSPWEVVIEGDRLYGRGTADNKGQHTINIGALECVLAERGSLGFNSTILIETGEEVGSPGLADFCNANKHKLMADVLIGSDGPRVDRYRPTISGGARGVFNFTLKLNYRQGGHHSGNWGGLLANPGIVMAHALSVITDDRGQIKVPEWRPQSLSGSVRAALADVHIDAGDNTTKIDPEWGEISLSPAERVFGWNNFEVLAFKTGDPDQPENAIPPNAVAHCQLRFVVGTDPHDILPALSRHLAKHGFGEIEVVPTSGMIMNATRLDPDNPWAKFAATSIEQTVGQKANILPNIGGSLANDVFTDILGMPTVWVPHSYAGCCQHAPDEHLLAPLAREGLRLMTGLFWDLGAEGYPPES
ncbi:M20 family metallopeptidase [Bradyrhizobium sp. USDA 3650]